MLAGGLGTRLAPMTKVTNKHLLDVYDEPMIYYPIRTLAKAGIKDIVVVTGKEIDQFKSLLGTGRKLDVRLKFEQQEGEKGIADALGKARQHIDEPMVVILGDNIYQEDLSRYIQGFQRGAKILLREVGLRDAQRFGVAYISDGKVSRIEEKPKFPMSNLAVTGCYVYDERVFEIIDATNPSARGELEITDVNNTYVAAGEMQYDILQGWWTDAGTPESKLKASIMVSLTKGVTFNA